MDSPSTVTIYTDGGADPNPGPGGWGAVLVHDASGRERELWGGEERTTNNRMELTAAIRALEALERPCRVRLLTDSRYLQKGVRDWLPKWRELGFKRRTGELANEDLWRRLAELSERHEVRWEWVKGHAGDRLNERADELATRGVGESRRRSRERSVPAAAALQPADVEVWLKVSASRQGAGWAALVRQGGEEQLLEGRVSEGRATANLVDVLAATAVIEALPGGGVVAIHTASDYLRNGASNWLAGWRQRGWKTRDGKPVANREAWERLDAALCGRRVRWPEVAEGAEELGRLEAAARQAARGEPVGEPAAPRRKRRRPG